MSCACLSPPAAEPPLHGPHFVLPTLQACTEEVVLRASFPAFSLPTDGQKLALLVRLSALDCSGTTGGALLSLGAVSLSVACSAEGRFAGLVLAGAVDTASTHLALPPGSDDGSSGLVLLLTADRAGGSIALCANGQWMLPAGGDDLLQRLGDLSPAELVGPAVVLGAGPDGQLSARADVSAAYAADFAVPCSSTAPGEAQVGLLQLLAEAAAASSGGAASLMPRLAVEQQPSGDATVGRNLQLTATATPDSSDDTLRQERGLPCKPRWPAGSQGCLGELLSSTLLGRAAMLQPLREISHRCPRSCCSPGAELSLPTPHQPACRLRLTLFGLTPPGCTAAECGDWAVNSAAASPGQPVSLDVTAAYPKAGRYVARLEASAPGGVGRRGGAARGPGLQGREGAWWLRGIGTAPSPGRWHAPAASSLLTVHISCRS